MKSLTPWRPLQELETLQRSMEEMFEQFSDRKNGVLEITVPAPKQLESKKIQIEAQK